MSTLNNTHSAITGFEQRHIGPNEDDVTRMLDALGVDSLQSLLQRTVPENIRFGGELKLPPALDEAAALAELANIADQNVVQRSCIGQGYYGTHVPPVLLRNVFENPGWYTAYTPYQPEIAQGRLEVLFNFQTLIAELTNLPVANASLLDEATAVAEAVALAHRNFRGKRDVVVVSADCHPQTLAVLKTRCEVTDVELLCVEPAQLADSLNENVCAVVVQYPATDGHVANPKAIVEATHAAGALMIMSTDLLALTLLTPPGELGADIAVGSAQRFGVPMGFGGPHAAFIAVTDKLKRSLPGRLVGQSVDANGHPAYRLALQTREQHIRREKATSNICTAQALLAIMATLYACYHGPAGLRAIATRVQLHTQRLQRALADAGLRVRHQSVFDTLAIDFASAAEAQNALESANAAGYNLRRLGHAAVAISLDETTTTDDLQQLSDALCADHSAAATAATVQDDTATADTATADTATAMSEVDAALLRAPGYMSQRCFHEYRSETQMMRYLRTLADRDIALDRAMIPLGSCTMKLNSAAEMLPVSWTAFSQMHPYAPAEQTQGYRLLTDQLENWLATCTGYAGISLQPNAGSQGEFAGLLAIRRYHEARGDMERDICLIPSSAHGTNPASAQMAGMQVVVVACDKIGNIDIADLDEKLQQWSDRVAAIMVTYPSTHGVFESSITDVCGKVHAAGGQVYIDGANLNALVGLAQPGEFGGDVSHLNLHKTFCIPHGGGGPGIGPIGVAEHLLPFLPGTPVPDLHSSGEVNQDNDADNLWAVSAAHYGSASILPITWMYLRMMGASALTQASSVAILSANYIAHRLSSCYPVLYTGDQGHVAHECIIDLRPIKEQTGISVDDIAKRLMDYGFHAPTMSFPVPGTLMIEPTESESLQEIDRFIDAMLAIYQEIQQVASGAWPLEDNPLVNAPHTAAVLLQDDWTHPYSRKEAAYPAGPQQSATKYWPPVGRIDNVYGDKHLVCSCPPMETYSNEAIVDKKSTAPKKTSTAAA